MNSAGDLQIMTIFCPMKTLLSDVSADDESEAENSGQ